MKGRLNYRNVLFVVVLLVLLAASPFALHENYRAGSIYIFSGRFLRDLPKRLTGPGRFRFILQPAVAIFLGIRAGIADARARRTPYLLSIAMERTTRTALLREGFAHLSTLIAMSVLLDAIAQLLIIRRIYPGAALIVGPVLIGVPYAVSRALANRASRFKRTKATVSL